MAWNLNSRALRENHNKTRHLGKAITEKIGERNQTNRIMRRKVMKYSIRDVEPIYTGGNIYCFIGKTNDNYFLAESSNFDVRILCTDPHTEDFEAVWMPEWQEKNLVKDLLPINALEFFEEMVEWIKSNEPDGNYSMSEISELGEEVKELTSEKNWR